jgi:phosphoribosylformylglycinamidine cyclo-ligase
MPGFYPPGDFDVAGFAVGVVERDKIVNGQHCKPGDDVIGLAASGAHSNGFSLIRMLLERGLIQGGRVYDGLDSTLMDALLVPTRLYLPLASRLAELAGVKAMAHITGGGLPGNIARPVPDNLDLILDSNRWPLPPLFQIIAQAEVARDELYATFNMGLGYTVVADPSESKTVIDLCREAGVEAWVVGELTPGSGKVIING